MKITDFMKISGTTQDQLADKLGWHKSQVSRIASGKRLPSLKQAIELERATNGAVTPRDFICGTQGRAA